MLNTIWCRWLSFGLCDWKNIEIVMTRFEELTKIIEPIEEEYNRLSTPEAKQAIERHDKILKLNIFSNA